MTNILVIIGAIIAGIFRGIAFLILGVVALIFLGPIVLGFLGGIVMGIMRACGIA